jgi:hypothetical protein
MSKRLGNHCSIHMELVRAYLLRLTGTTSLQEKLPHNNGEAVHKCCGVLEGNEGRRRVW